jgi:Zn-finger nucleic acid-binding protein
MKGKRPYECPDCGARLQVIRVEVVTTGRERATCPNCKGVLLARDGNDLLIYKLVARPVIAGGE